MDEFEVRYRALASRDARFDGRFFTGVTSTGVYCRPICPARTPARANVRFFRHAAAAEVAGFRACKRCRPDASPDSPDWDVRADLAGRALRLIADGTVDRDGVAGLASRLAVSERHLTRVLSEEVGAPPLALARSRRARLARQLLDQTGMRISDIAFAAGFSSLRSFNDTMRELYRASPSELRRRRGGGPAAPLTLRLTTRTPFDATALLAFLAARAIPGVEEVADGTYRRSVPGEGGPCFVALTPNGAGVGLSIEGTPASLPAVVQGARRLLDLDADPSALTDALGADPAIGRRIRRAPGLRLPGAFDGFETAVRVLLGQQVSVAGATTIAGRLVARAGIGLDGDARGSLTHHFPTPNAVATMDADALGVPGARARAVRALAAAVAAGDIALDGSADPAATERALLALPGIGPWSTSVIAMRALRDPDAFPASDLGLRRAAVTLRLPDRPTALSKVADRWRPWRAYAAMHLWQVT